MRPLMNGAGDIGRTLRAMVGSGVLLQTNCSLKRAVPMSPSPWWDLHWPHIPLHFCSNQIGDFFRHGDVWSVSTVDPGDRSISASSRRLIRRSQPGRRPGPNGEVNGSHVGKIVLKVLSPINRPQIVFRPVRLILRDTCALGSVLGIRYGSKHRNG